MNLVGVILALLVESVYSWSAPSHVIIYMIARKEIGTAQTALVDKIINEMPEPDIKYPNPYEIALWADDMKGNGVDVLSGFHYYDQLFCDGIDPKKVTAILDPTYNVVNAVITTYKTLKYKPPFPYHFNGRFEKSFALRLLIHMVGDMHQPLHTATRCTPAKPECDAGGNGFPINDEPHAKNLHALWDQAMGKINAERRPLNQTAIDKYQAIADQIVSQFPRSSLESDLEEKDQWKIAKKHLQLAIDYAYNGIKENDKPSEEYKNSRFEICKKQIALAGYRLADMLKDIVFSMEEST
jgi:hypothetical protein